MWAGVAFLLCWHAQASLAPSSQAPSLAPKSPTLRPTVSPARADALGTQYIVGSPLVLFLRFSPFRSLTYSFFSPCSFLFSFPLFPNRGFPVPLNMICSGCPDLCGVLFLYWCVVVSQEARAHHSRPSLECGLLLLLSGEGKQK